MFSDLPEVHKNKLSNEDKSKKTITEKIRSIHENHHDRRHEKELGKSRYFDKPEDENLMVDSLEQMKQTMRSLEKKSTDKKNQVDVGFLYDWPFKNDDVF